MSWANDVWRTLNEVSDKTEAYLNDHKQEIKEGALWLGGIVAGAFVKEEVEDLLQKFKHRHKS